MRGASEIKELRLEVMKGVIEQWMEDPSLIFQDMFPTDYSESDTITWETVEGSRGLAPIVPPGSPAPKTAPLGVSESSAKAAMIKEKMHFDEEFLNNMREPGTLAKKRKATATLAKNLGDLQNRVKRRIEWMFAKMITAGSFTYQNEEGVNFTVDYNVPTAHKVTLATDNEWGSGSDVDILGDIIDGVNVIKDANGGRVDYMYLNSVTLRKIGEDSRIINLLQKSTFGDGSLFNTNEAGRLAGVNTVALGRILNIDNMVVHDEQYQIRSRITANVSAAGTTIYVMDTTDFVAGETLRIHDRSANTYEDVTISAVNHTSGTLTVSAVTNAYKAYEDYVTMTSYFVPSNKVILMASRVGGAPIAEKILAPYGNNGRYGVWPDRKEQWDPEGIDVRVQWKGLPVLKQKDALYILTVG